MILKIFSLKKMRKMAFLTQNKAKLCNILIITLVLEKNAFFAENWQKSQKTVIITTTPGIVDWSTGFSTAEVNVSLHT
jgi:hypothetical protein